MEEGWGCDEVYDVFDGLKASDCSYFVETALLGLAYIRLHVDMGPLRHLETRDSVQIAHELRNTPVKVNSAHPGWVKTELGGEGAMMDIEEGAKTGVELALLPDDEPSGGFFHLGQPVPW